MHKPRFKVGDPVREKSPMTSVGDEKGIVIKSYELNEQYRCVVQFESGREAVLFEAELLLDAH
jgi:hypothetical protein